MNKDEFEIVKDILNSNIYINSEILIELNYKLENIKIIKRSEAKIKATHKATKIKIQQTKAKIENGINMQRFENKKFTYYSIGKSSGVSLNTVKKYISADKLQSLNSLII